MISPSKGFSGVSVHRLMDGDLVKRRDVVAVEEPLEIRLEQAVDGVLKHFPISITMRTPGDEFDLDMG